MINGNIYKSTRMYACSPHSSKCQLLKLMTNSLVIKEKGKRFSLEIWDPNPRLPHSIVKLLTLHMTSVHLLRLLTRTVFPHLLPSAFGSLLACHNHLSRHLILNNVSQESLCFGECYALLKLWNSLYCDIFWKLELRSRRY